MPGFTTIRTIGTALELQNFEFEDTYQVIEKHAHNNGLMQSVFSEFNDAAADINALAAELGNSETLAILNGGIYPSAAAGIAATTDGQYFYFADPSGVGHVYLYKNDGGSALYQSAHPSVEDLNKLYDELTRKTYLGHELPLEDGIGALGSATVILAIPSDTDGTITNLDVFCSAAGTFFVSTWDKDGDCFH